MARKQTQKSGNPTSAASTAPRAGGSSNNSNIGSSSPGNGRAQVFSIRAPDAANVQLVGDFTQWQDRPINLQKETDGTWKATVILPPGTHQYRFLVDGHWCDDPACKHRSPNPFGGENMMRQVA